MRTITRQELIDANVTAFLNGSLSALGPEPSPEYERRASDGRLYVCAIGCVLTALERSRIVDKGGNRWSIQYPLFREAVPIAFEDENFASSLQHDHDDACSSHEGTRRNGRRRYLRRIGL